MPDTLEDPRTTANPDGSHDNLPGLSVPSDEDLNKMVYGGAPDTPASLQSYTAGGNSNPDPDLSKMESAGGDTDGTIKDSFYENNPEQEPRPNIKSKFKGLSGRKKWAILSLSSLPTVIIPAMVAVLVIMFLSGFQLGAVARVLGDVNFIFTKRMSRTLTKRAIYALSNPASQYKISEGAISKLGLRSPNNPIVDFEGTGNVITGRPEGVKIGNKTVSLNNNLTINTPLGRQNRLSLLSDLDNALSEVPEIGRLGPLAKNRRTLALAESLGYKYSAWDKGKRFWQGIRDEASLKKAVGEYLEDKYSLVKKAKIKFGSNDLNEAATKTEKAALADGSIGIDESAPQLGLEAGTEAVAKSASAGLATFAKGLKQVGDVAQFIGYYCLFRDLAKIIKNGKLERMYAYARSGMNILTAYDQFKTGDSSPFAVNMAVRDLGLFQNTTTWATNTYQYSVSQAKNLGYTAMPVADIMWAPTALVQRIISFVGQDLGPLSGSIDGMCGVLTSAEGIIATVAVEFVAQALICFVTACIGSAGTKAGTKAAVEAVEQAGEELAGEVVDKLAKETAEKLAKEAVEEGLEKAAEAGIKQGLRGFFGKYRRLKSFGEVVTKGGAVIGGIILLQKAAAAGSALDAGCIGGNDNCMNLANQGLRMIGNTQVQSMGGRPSTQAEIAEVKQTQYEEVLLANKNMPFSERLLGLTNPRSPLSLMLANIPLRKSTIYEGSDRLLAYIGNIFSPVSSGGLFASTLKILNTDNLALAQSSDEEEPGYHVWFYSKAEEEKITTDPSFDPDTNKEFVESRLEDLKSKYGKCYEKDEATSFDADEGFLLECSTLLKEEDALHYRIYLADEEFKKQQEYIANATESSGSQTTLPIGDFYGDSTSTPCAAGSDDYGEAVGYRSGRPFKIRLCTIAGLLSGRGDADAGGIARFNSSISLNVVSMINEAKAAGLTPKMNSSYRTMEYQQELRRQANCPNDTTNNCDFTVARAGFSNHQMGLAFDIQPDSDFWQWMINNGERFGYKWYGSGDRPHFSPTGG